MTKMMSKIYTIILLIFASLSQVQAGVDDADIFITGSQIATSSTMEIQDQNYSCLVDGNCTFTFLDNSAEIVVSLDYKEELLSYIASGWKLKVTYDVDSLNQEENVTSLYYFHTYNLSRTPSPSIQDRSP